MYVGATVAHSSCCIALEQFLCPRRKHSWLSFSSWGFRVILFYHFQFKMYGWHQLKLVNVSVEQFGCNCMFPWMLFVLNIFSAFFHSLQCGSWSAYFSGGKRVGRWLYFPGEARYRGNGFQCAVSRSCNVLEWISSVLCLFLHLFLC